MSIKSHLAIWAGKNCLAALKLLKRNGGSLPGKIALQIDENALRTLAKNYETVIITGTNGKTLTTALTVQALKQINPNVLTNSTGSNMTQGITSAFLGHRTTKNEKPLAVLEIDEAYLQYMVEALNPKAIVTTNIFRDQMDRFGEIYTIYQKILDGIRLAPNATVIANGDAPIFNSVTLPNKQVYFGFDHVDDGDLAAHYNTDGILCPHCQKIIRYKHNVYANLGKYYCPHCAFKRPDLKHAVTALQKLSLERSQFQIDHVDFDLPVAGLYNIYNALAAYSVAREFGLAPQAIAESFSKMPRVFGRQEIVHVEDKHVLINLIKNPVGLNQVLDLLKLQDTPCSVIAVLNDNYADGQDVSWIWDGQFEDLTQLNIQQIGAGGARLNEMAVRLEVAGFDPKDIIQARSIQDVLTFIKNAPTKQVYVLATYTAMLSIRKALLSEGYVKGEMN
ncbi:Mur ligase family protein [Carnobacteriaceae bacterium zg-ZUI252]|nr:Mur ligase family protein [Carnobacteriaceae bacterium zg-ZUI252]